MRRATLVLVLAASAAASLGAQTEKLDHAMLGRIRDEGLARSQVMDHISWLSDVYGPRLTGSPGLQQASEWVMKKFGEWGLAVAHQERWAFGKGWSLVRFSAHLVEPQVQPIIGFPHSYDENTPNGFNTIAEIPGSDLASEVVLLGAHLDSHPYATGATDNATGNGAVMEAMRILKAVGAKPRRTIRAALWGGEEQGLLGARAYVREHLADVDTMTLKPEHARLAAYFNTDNGTGRVRGIWMQSNGAVRPVFEAWIAPLRDLGVTTLGPRSVASTDHVPFDEAGVPAFQFMVERLEYNSRTHHSNMDTFDRVQREDMVQQATVIAVFAYNAAMRDEKLPRKALPAARRGRGTSSQQ